MPSANNEITVEFRLGQIQIVKSALDLASISRHHTRNYNYNVRVQLNFNEDRKQISVQTEINVSVLEENLNLGDVIVLCVFDVLNWDMIVTKVGNNFQIAKAVATLFNGISVSTTRGILFTLFYNVKVEDVILPVLDASTFQIQPEEA